MTGSGIESFRPAPPTPKEREDVEMLTTMMGSEVSFDVVLTVLRRNSGNVEKAATALLEGDTGQPPPVHTDLSLANMGKPDINVVGPRTPPPSGPEGNPPVIDLTADDDDELSRALKASLEDQAPKFGPSNRAPDANWAVVPSNVAVNEAGISQEDQSLNRAIEASLNYEMSPDAYEDLPLEDRIRKGDIPIALRPTESRLTYAGLIIHGLFFIPQIRHSIAQYRPSPEEGEDLVQEGDKIEMSPPRSGPAHWVWSLLEMFANMELARTTELNIDQLLSSLTAETWNSLLEHPGDLSYRFYTKIAWAVEGVLHGHLAVAGSQDVWPRLFHFRYGYNDSEPNSGPFDKRLDTSIVKVDIRGTPEANDLISCLSSDFSPPYSHNSDSTDKQQVIFEPSEVVAFQLSRENTLPSRGERQTFGYPKHVYLDQFLNENAELAREKRKSQMDLHAEIERLQKRRTALTHHDNRDTILDLRSSLHYYENIAEHNNNEERKTTIQDNAIKLRKILTRIENELQTIDATITKHQAQAAAAFDCPELQKYRYDLRVVLVHTGLYGRNHLYSYVKQKDTWWKTLDYAVTEVLEETVLTDTSGLHLNAGPYFLIYSRALPPEQGNQRAEYPEGIKNSVKHNNKMFFAGLPQDLQDQIEDPNSPPTSPYVPNTPSEYTMSSGIAEPPSSREDTMDMSV